MKRFVRYEFLRSDDFIIHMTTFQTKKYYKKTGGAKRYSSGDNFKVLCQRSLKYLENLINLSDGRINEIKILINKNGLKMASLL